MFSLPTLSIDSGLHTFAGQSASFDNLTVSVASTFVYVAAAIALAAIWRARQAGRAAVSIVVGALLALGAGQLIGAAWFRPRPFDAEHFQPLMAHGRDSSMPSDHLLAAGALFAGVWLVHRRASVLVALVAVLLGAARCIAGVHYITDVVAGFAIGSLATLLAWTLLAPLDDALLRLDSQLIRWHLRPGASPVDQVRDGAGG